MKSRDEELTALVTPKSTGMKPYLIKEIKPSMTGIEPIIYNGKTYTATTDSTAD